MDKNNKKTKAAYTRVYGLTVTEHKEQINLIHYIDIQYKGIIYCASAGGLHTSDTQAIKMKRAGYKAGFPDLFFYEPRGGYHGLAIELKRKDGGQTSPLQKEWLNNLSARGYYATVAKGFDEAKKVIDWYLSLGTETIAGEPNDVVVIAPNKQIFTKWLKECGMHPGEKYHHVMTERDTFGLKVKRVELVGQWYTIPSVGQLRSEIEKRINKK